MRKIFIHKKGNPESEALLAQMHDWGIGEITDAIPPVLTNIVLNIPALVAESATQSSKIITILYPPDITESNINAITDFEKIIAPTNIPHYAIVEDFNTSSEKPLKVKRTLEGKEFHIWCYVSQDIKEAYVAGDLQIGDVVIVIFVDNDITMPLAQQKVFKTW